MPRISFQTSTKSIALRDFEELWFFARKKFSRKAPFSRNYIFISGWNFFSRKRRFFRNVHALKRPSLEKVASLLIILYTFALLAHLRRFDCVPRMENFSHFLEQNANGRPLSVTKIFPVPSSSCIEQNVHFGITIKLRNASRF